MRRDQLGKGKTDWKRVKSLTAEDIAKAVADDPDAAALDIDWSDAELVIPPAKKPISIRLDEDLIAFFKQSGPGYQTRINAILRHYMITKARTDA